MGHAFRAAVFGAAILMSGASAGFGQEVSELPPAIVAQINQSAATQSADSFAQTVAALAAANPNLAAAIAGKATEIRPAAATNIARSLAAVIPPAQAQTVVSAIVNALPPADRPAVGASVVTTYISAAPPSVQSALTIALAPVLAQATQPAAGPSQGQGQNQQQKEKVDIQGVRDTVQIDAGSRPSAN